MSKILSGAIVAKKILEQVRNDLATFDTSPALRIAMVGQHAASAIYIRRKQKVAESLGLKVVIAHFPDQTSADELIAAILGWNNDPTVTAVLVQMPLPEHIDQHKVLSSISPSKDVDGLHPLNLGLLLTNQPRIVPATARGVMKLLDYYDTELVGRMAVVVGRSVLVGMPTALLLTQAGATVTIAHRQTPDLKTILGHADIVVSAAGQPGLIKPEQVRQDAVIVDVGITRGADGLSGDANLVSQLGEVNAISPVPGGVGPLTVACLMENIVVCHHLQQQPDMV